MRIIAVTSLVLICLCGLAVSQSTETVLYNFRGYPADGSGPYGALVFDSAGKAYGVTSGGGKYCFEDGGCGTIYELTPTASGEWIERVLYDFCSTGNPDTCPDGAFPTAGLIIDARGNLYGTASGGIGTAGTVFRLSPSSEQGGSWTETVLWNFTLDLQNGRGTVYGALNMDAAGNLYGTTTNGGSKNAGTVYELSPQSDGTYAFSILHSFSGPDGVTPDYGVTFDSKGNLYGTTSEGGRGKSICNYGCGLVYELSPSGGTWKETVLFEFDGVVGAWPLSPISIDQSGNLYGTFEKGGGGTTCYFITCGGVFKLVPGSNRKYVFDFANEPNDGTPESGVAIGPGNTLFGTEGIIGAGQVYMLQGSQETILYNFCSLANCTDGELPTYGNIVIHNGSLYGATIRGGSSNNGVIYSLTK